MTDRFFDRQHQALAAEVAELVKSGAIQPEDSARELARRFRDFRNCYPD